MACLQTIEDEPVCASTRSLPPDAMRFFDHLRARSAAIDDRASDLLEELNVSWPVREAIKLAFIDPHLKELLEL